VRQSAVFSMNRAPSKLDGALSYRSRNQNHRRQWLDAYGTDAATGLGLQLIYGKVVNASVSDMYNARNMWKSGSSWDVPAPTDGRTSFKLPLAVNYYQTADRVTPGKANTQFTVNIDYK
ncbi:hypothetical protein ACU6ZM_24250, partial [Klebsiella aerogenes]